MGIQKLFTALTFISMSFVHDARAKTLNFRMIEAPVSLDWNGLSTMLEAPLILNLNEGLYKYDYQKNQLIPGLAESVIKSKDLSEYTFKIRKDAKWSDGRPIYAQDFADAWLRLLSPQSTSIYIYYLFDIENAREYNTKKTLSSSDVGIKAVDDQTLKIKLRRPSQDWEKNTAFWPLFPIRKDQIEKYGSNWWRAGVLISSGPFVFDSYELGKKAILKRNPYYLPKKHSNVDEVDVYFISDHQEAIKKYEDGTFPFLWNLSPKLLPQFKGSKEMIKHPLMRVHLLGLNTAKFPMNNRDFRKAILMAIDTPKLIPSDATQLKSIETLIPPPILGSKASEVLKLNLKQAREHLKKSGVIIGKNFTFRILTGISEPFLSMGKLLQSQLSQNLGMNVELAALPGQEYTAYMNLGEYHATLITWTSKVLSPQDFLLPYSGEASYNRMNFKNEFFDQYIFEGVRSKSSLEAEKSFEKAQNILSVEEAVASPLFSETTTNLISPKIKQIYFNHMGIPILSDAQITSP